MKIILVGGGTSGHINPALNIAEYIKKINKNAKILYVGSKTTIPFPVYTGFTADSPVTAPLNIFPIKSPAPFTFVSTFMFPVIHCKAPACNVIEFPFNCGS